MEQDLIPYSAATQIAARAVLVLAPHPDDEVFGCGGALALHARAGVPVDVVVLTGGSAHGDADVRATESRAAAHLLGTGKPDFWNLPDRGLLYGEALVERIVARARASGADLLYAPAPSEIHPDHRQATLLAMEAVRRLGAPARLAFYEVGSPLRPNLLLDITPVLALKKRAMRCFDSQQAHQDYVRHIAALNTYRTYTLPAAVQAAEAFWLVSAADLAQGAVARSLAQVSPGIAPVAAEDAPLVSVLVRSMDRPSLAAALDSVALQTYPNIEIVVLSAAPAHAPLPPTWGPFPLRLVVDGQAHPRSAAANLAMQAAQGRWLVFLDDDDWFLPGHIARLAATLRSLPASRAAYTGVGLVDMDDVPQGQALDLPFDPTQQLAGNLMQIHAELFEASLVQEGCAFDERLDRYEDWDFWMQLARRTTLAHLPGVSACYRIHTSSGVHEDAGPRGQATSEIYRKWQDVWRDDEKSAVMQRVWDFPDLENRLAQTQAYAAVKETEIAQLQQRLSEGILRARAAAAQADRELQAQRAAVRDSQYALELRTADLAALHASRSWRLTRPVRTVTDWLRAHPVLRGARQRLTGSAPPPLPLAVAPAALPSHDPGMDYGAWVAEHDTPDVQQLEALRTQVAALAQRPLISVVMPVYNPPLDLLREAIVSVQAQVYPHWELCIADDASPDPQVWELLQALSAEDARIRTVRREANGHISAASNSALALAQGEFVALMDNDDLLPPDALFRIAEAIDRQPTAAILYSDEDKLDMEGVRFGPYFKPDWNHTLFMGHNLISHLGVYRTALMREVGGFRLGLEGSQDYDLALRCIERIDPRDIVHVPRVLYHWRAIPGSTALGTEAKPYAMTAAQQALEEHLLRTGQGGTVDMLPSSNYRYRPADTAWCDQVSLVLVADEAPSPDAPLPAWTRDPEHGVAEAVWAGPDAESIDAAIRRTTGPLVALVHGALQPAHADALRELSRFAARPGTAMAGGTVRDAQGRIVNGGLVLNPQSFATPLHAGRGEDDGGYMGRAQLAQELSALAPDCVVLRRDALEEAGLLDAALGNTTAGWVDLSLRLRARGLRLVWVPSAAWRATPAYCDRLAGRWHAAEDVSATPALSAAVERHRAWLERDPAYHPAFDAAAGNFAIARR